MRRRTAAVRRARPRTLVAALAAGLVVTLLPAASGAQAQPGGGERPGDGGLALTPLSTRADFVTGGDVLVRVDIPDGADPGEVAVRRNGTDVTGAFTPDPGGQRLTGLVAGLKDGANSLVATAPDGDGGGDRAELRVRNHPTAGPVISGPHEDPYVCTTEYFALVDGTTLGPPLDEDCSVGTRVDYAYRSTDGKTKPLPDPDERPADLAETTTTDGKTVPFLIRIETGTVNRAVYQISMLHDPADPEPGTTARSAGWNGRLVYTFGGGCRAGWYTQGVSTGGVLDPEMLGRGYAVASSSLNVFGNNCNDLLAAETTMMVKEQFTEAYGTPRFTIGWGCSGGSYQGHQIADNYPGLLDGIVVGCSFPDVTSATNLTLLDSRVLHGWFEGAGKGEFSAEQQRAVSGFRLRESIPNLSDGAKRLDPDEEFPLGFPDSQRYDAETNPDGVRGTVYDHTVNVYGTDPATGAALRPLDNTGVQYGLGALNDGTIDKRQFLDLNSGVGGIDRDARPTKSRTAADPSATRAAYGTGRILDGGAGLSRTPVIDYRAYTDDTPGGDIHMAVHGFSTRARLLERNGHADNHVMLEEDVRHGGFSLESPVLRYALSAMDEWLTSLTADGAPLPGGAGPAAERPSGADVVAHKPAGLTDACWTPDEQPRKITQRLTYDNRGECGKLYPAFPTPRLVAGAPVADDVVACRRKPVEPADYAVEFTPAELAELRETFPGGVCDWAREGRWQRPLDGTWQALPSGPGAAGD
ncbi:hypothetical protein DVA86_19795 [Streptomyces armeniacus]|uniref:DUF6351 domain-containing protein n=1 Tax=Streptomyces armeniacus TaxID=83291 RepID=A0A345Y0S1_9ACTN|nr:hypothetical protein DVA86_19795 [Streptomyces armeniacus]